MSSLRPSTSLRSAQDEEISHMASTIDWSMPDTVYLILSLSKDAGLSCNKPIEH
jgi:hypothetical protein